MTTQPDNLPDVDNPDPVSEDEALASPYPGFAGDQDDEAV